jgi:hypothetical protein
LVDTGPQRGNWLRHVIEVEIAPASARFPRQHATGWILIPNALSRLLDLRDDLAGGVA